MEERSNLPPLTWVGWPLESPPVQRLDVRQTHYVQLRKRVLHDGH